VTFTLSPPVRIAALLGLLATVLVGGGMTVIGRGEPSEATPHVIKHHPFGASAKPAKQAPATPAAAAKKHSAAKATTPKAATPAQPIPKAPERPSVVVAALKAGLPASIATALGQHRVVVVSLYNPYSEVDGISFAEARAGAQLAGAGFVPLNVLSRAQVGKLTELLGLLPDPGLLVYVRPGTLAVRLSGFVDKETVAQAAQNAARGS
jgi:pyruvate/2-oxoglutarate dehydrogenase complex dihydrolipoamide acyltransferase (E2) component